MGSVNDFEDKLNEVRLHPKMSEDSRFFTKAGFQINALSSASDWLIFIRTKILEK